jgi:hypothetical protein
MLEDNVIPFRFRVDNLPWVITILFVVTILFQYTFFTLQGRYTNYIPTLAETAVTSPNSIILSSVVSLIAFLYFLVLTSVVTWGEVYGVFKPSFLTVGQIGAFLCPAFLLVFANLRLDDWLDSLWVGAVPFLFTTLIFCFIIFQQLFSQVSITVRVVRMVTLILGTIALILSFVPIDPQPRAVTMKAICEQVFVLLMLVFLITLRVELGQLKVDVVILPEEDK